MATEEFIPQVPEGEKQSTYEVTDKYFSPLTGASDVKPIVKEDITLYPKEFAFLLNNVLSPSECQYYIEKGEEMGLDELDKTYRKDYRNNDRCVARGTEVAELIWNRVKEFMEPMEITSSNNMKVGSGYGFEGKWTPDSLNDVFRICKYHPGGHFAPHYDGNFIKTPSLRSMKTFMLYLNEDFEGASTNFVDESQALYKEGGIFKAEEKNILMRIKPVTGMALVFNPELLHEGEQLRSGVKYIMRSEVMYVQQSTREFNPKESEAMQLFQEAERLESEKKASEAAECYRKAFKLWPPLADAYNS